MRLKKGRLWTNRPPRERPGKAFTRTAHLRPHGLKVVRERPGLLPNLVECGCGRAEEEDMMVAYGGRWICCGCLTHIRRAGELDDEKIDVGP